MSGPTMIIDSSAISSGATTTTQVIPLTFTSSEATSDFVSGDITTTNGNISSFESTGGRPNVTALSGYIAVAIYNTIDTTPATSLTIQFAYLGGSAHVKVMQVKNSPASGSGDANLITLTSTQNYNVSPVIIENWELNDYIMIYLKDIPSAAQPVDGAACYIYIPNSLSELGLDNKPTSINCFYSGGDIAFRFSGMGTRSGSYIQSPYDGFYISELGGSIWEVPPATYGNLYYFFQTNTTLNEINVNFGNTPKLTDGAGSGSGMYDPFPTGDDYVPLFFFGPDSGGASVLYTADFTASADGVCEAVVNAGAYTSGGIGNQVSNTFTWTYDGTAPFITHTTVANDNSTISVTFDEAVYNTDGGSGSLEVSDFVFSIAGGTATLASTEPITISESGNEYTLGLSLSGTPNGLEVVTVNPSSATSIYNEAGIAASVTQSNNFGSLNGPPTITSTTVASDNSTISVIFDETVYSTDGGSGSLDRFDFVFSIAGGIATLASTPSSCTGTIGSEYHLGMSLSGIPNGLEVVTVNPASATSIYNAGGIPASVTQSNNFGSLNGHPVITGTTVASNNSTISVTFDEAVYNTDGGSGSLEVSDFVFSIAGGSATLASTEPITISESGNEYTLGLSLSGNPNGLEVVTVNPASATSIYNVVGLAAHVIQSNNFGSLNAAPIITGTTVASNNSTISVTFDEAVYNTDGGSGSLEVSDFVFSIAGGAATLASTEPITISESGNEYTLGLSLSGTPNGLEVVTVNPVLSSIYNAGGVAAYVIQSNNFGSLNAAPIITGTTVASDNSTISVTFDEAVYNTDGGSGSLEVSDFVFSIAGGEATLASTEPITISESGNEYTLGLSLTGIADGLEVVTVNPASATSIYNAAGIAASVTQSINNFGSLNAEPTITATSLASDNSTVTVTFAGAVYSTDGGSGSLEASDFHFVLVGGTATLASTPISISEAGNDYTLGLSLTGIADGLEVVTVNPASATSIYNAAGIAASVTQSNNTVTLKVLPTMTIDSTTVSDGGTTSSISVDLTFTSSQVTTDFASGDITATNGVISDFEGIEVPAETALSVTEDSGYIPIALYNKGPDNLTIAFAYLGDPVADAVMVMDTVGSLDIADLHTLDSGDEHATPFTPTGSWNTGDFVMIYVRDNASAVSPATGSACYIYISNSLNELGLENKPTSLNCYYGGGTLKLRFSDIGSGRSEADPNYVSSFLTDLDNSIWENGSTYGDLYYYFNDSSGTTLLTTNFGSTNEVNSSSGSGMYESTTYSSTPYIPFFFFSTGEGGDYTATFDSNEVGLCSVVVGADKFTDRAGNLNRVSNTFSWTYDETGPTMTITSHVLVSGSHVDVKKVILIFTSSIATTDFTLGDISFSGGTIGRFSCVDCNSAGSIYTAIITIDEFCTTAAVWVEAGKYTDAFFHHPNTASNTFTWTYVPHCPIPAILPTGVLAPHSGNLSQKMIQANKVIYSSSHGGQKYISNKPYIDPKIRPIGKIYYTRYITFYLYSDPLTISTFFSMFPWSNYGNTLSESLELATLFLTMLSNVPRRLSADHLLPYYATTTEVSYLKYVDGSITGGDILLTDTQPYFLIFNNLS